MHDSIPKSNVIKCKLKHTVEKNTMKQKFCNEMQSSREIILQKFTKYLIWYI